MTRVISATVYLRDSCDPDLPGDCAPLIELKGAAELEGLVSAHGVAFEEALQEPEDTFSDDLIEDEAEQEPEFDLESDEIQTDQLECPLEPEVDWDESICGQIERRILSRVLGG